MGRPTAFTGLLVAALAITLLAAASSGWAQIRRQQGAGQGAGATLIAPPIPAAQPALAPAPATPPPRAKRSRPPGFGVVRVRAGRSVKLRARPGGSVVARLGHRTEFGSRTTFAVVEERGRWLAVTSAALPNGREGWLRADRDDVDRGRVRTAISIDLSRRSVELRRGDRILRRVRVAVGRSGSSTPRGRFAVTDKLPGSRYGSYYGCCILALSGRQTNLPPGWRGGNRLAIHGTNAPGAIGTASSAGCLRASDRDLRTLMRRVPLGTPVFIHG